jgi:hypothetical protein
MPVRFHWACYVVTLVAVELHIMPVRPLNWDPPERHVEDRGEVSMRKDSRSEAAAAADVHVHKRHYGQQVSSRRLTGS